MRWMFVDHIPVQGALLDGFGEMGRLDIFLTLQIGNRSGRLQYPGISPGT